MPTTRNLAILIFEDVEVLDFCGPFEVFSVANRFTDPAAFNVFTVAEKAGPALTRGGLNVNPHHRLADCPPPDVLLVPGGQGTRKEMHNPALIEWIKQASTKAELVLSVCTGALLLAKAGLLDGLEATTHHGAIELLREVAPTTTVHADRRFVDNGLVVCSAGIAAGIDMSLHVVGRLLRREVAEKTARQMASRLRAACSRQRGRAICWLRVLASGDRRAVAGLRACPVAGFGGGDAEENFVGLDRQEGQADAALDDEFFADPQHMLLHGCASVRLGRVRTVMGKGCERAFPPGQGEGRAQGRRAVLRTPGARGSAGPDALHEQQK
jgi:putative intracellular protease/amidase